MACKTCRELERNYTKLYIQSHNPTNMFLRFPNKIFSDSRIAYKAWKNHQKSCKEKEK